MIKIYLDWNIYKYLKEPEKYNNDKLLYNSVKNLDEKLSNYFRQHAQKLNPTQGFVIISGAAQSLKTKIEGIGTPLKNWDIQIYRGILTGFNEAFIIDKAKKEELIVKSAKNADLIRPNVCEIDLHFAHCYENYLRQ